MSDSYIQKLKQLGLIEHLREDMGECEICVEVKLAKKNWITYLVHFDLGDFKSTIGRGGKQFYMTFLDNYFKYTRVFLLREKDEVCDFLSNIRGK